MYLASIAALSNSRQLLVPYVHDIDGDGGQGIVVGGGPRRLCTLLHTARPVLLDLSGGSVLRLATDWSNVVDLVEAVPELPRWSLPVTGEVESPAAVLIRPDGYVAWVGDDTDPAGLHRALTTWCGASR